MGLRTPRPPLFRTCEFMEFMGSHLRILHLREGDTSFSFGRPGRKNQRRPSACLLMSGLRVQRDPHGIALSGNKR